MDSPSRFARPRPAVSRIKPSTPTSSARSTWRIDATSANTSVPAACSTSITGAGEPTLVITIAGRYFSTSFTSSPSRVFVLCTIRFGANGAKPSVSICIRASQRSSSSTVRQFFVGNDPIAPARLAAITRSGPETSSIGAAISGKRSLRVIRSGRRAIVSVPSTPGSRFSANARRPSCRSSDCMTACDGSCCFFQPSTSVQSSAAERYAISFAARTATGELRAMTRASSSAPSSAFPAGTTLLTRPCWFISAAVFVSPVRIISIAT